MAQSRPEAAAGLPRPLQKSPGTAALPAPGAAKELYKSQKSSGKEPIDELREQDLASYGLHAPVVVAKGATVGIMLEGCPVEPDRCSLVSQDGGGVKITRAQFVPADGYFLCVCAIYCLLELNMLCECVTRFLCVPVDGYSHSRYMCIHACAHTQDRCIYVYSYVCMYVCVHVCVCIDNMSGV